MSDLQDILKNEFDIEGTQISIVVKKDFCTMRILYIISDTMKTREIVLNDLFYDKGYREYLVDEIKRDIENIKKETKDER